jgi:hypothetical protein
VERAGAVFVSGHNSFFRWVVVDRAALILKHANTPGAIDRVLPHHHTCALITFDIFQIKTVKPVVQMSRRFPGITTRTFFTSNTLVIRQVVR